MKKQTINIAFATDENYKYFTGVTIFSLLEHISEQYQYAIYILSQQPTEEHKNFFTVLGDNRKNVSFYFVDTKPWIDSVGAEHFYLSRYSIAAYYRLALPDILSDAEKILYLDSDLIIRSDVAELFLIQTQNALSAALDKNSRRLPRNLVEFAFWAHCKRRLNLKKTQKYFNSGVLLMDLDAMRHSNFVQQAEKLIHSDIEFICVDQDILNMIFEDNINYLPVTWNYEIVSYKNEYPFRKILHFAGITPWKKEVDPLAALWWETARRTPFFDSMYRETEPLRNEYRKWLEGQYFDVMESHSWKISAPLRFLAEKIRTSFKLCNFWINNHAE